MAASALSALLDDRALVDDVRSLSNVSNARAAAAIVRQWVVIAATVWLAIYVDRWWAYLPAMIVIASRQHALGIIMHDATHHRLFTSRAVNEYVSNLFCAFPMAMSTQGYRGEHLAHHLNTSTDDDPYYRMFEADAVWHWPKSRAAALRQVLADVSGWNTLKNVAMFRRWMPLTQWFKHRDNPALRRRCAIDLAMNLVFWACVAAVLTAVGGWTTFGLLWVVPGLTFYALFVRLRWISEHPYDPAAQAGYETRHVRGTLWERLTIAPLNINFHIAHHLFPAVPWYRLPTVHARLMQDAAYRAESEKYSTYLGGSRSMRSLLVQPAVASHAP